MSWRPGAPGRPGGRAAGAPGGRSWPRSWCSRLVAVFACSRLVADLVFACHVQTPGGSRLVAADLVPAAGRPGSRPGSRPGAPGRPGPGPRALVPGPRPAGPPAADQVARTTARAAWRGSKYPPHPGPKKRAGSQAARASARFRTVYAAQNSFDPGEEKRPPLSTNSTCVKIFAIPKRMTP